MRYDINNKQTNGLLGLFVPQTMDCSLAGRFFLIASLQLVVVASVGINHNLPNLTQEVKGKI